MKLTFWVLGVFAITTAGCSLSGPSPTVPFTMTGQLKVGSFLDQPFVVSCAQVNDCALTLQLTSMQPDPLTNVELEIVAFGADINGVAGCELGNVLASTITQQGGTGFQGRPVSSGQYCAVVADIGQLHETQNVTVSGQIPNQ